MTLSITFSVGKVDGRDCSRLIAVNYAIFSAPVWAQWTAAGTVTRARPNWQAWQGAAPGQEAAQ